eukprot:1805961-Alexandrium_andersonii.AAC.1
MEPAPEHPEPLLPLPVSFEQLLGSFAGPCKTASDDRDGASGKLPLAPSKSALVLLEPQLSRSLLLASSDG